MNDKELADKIVALGVGRLEKGVVPFAARYEIDGDLHNESHFEDQFVRDWRVAGAMMERLRDLPLHYDSCFVGDDSIPERAHKWEFSITTDLDAQVALVWNESLPRAINEACVEALT